MNTPLEFSAEARQNTGKRDSRRLREQKKLPAIIYGDDKDPQPVILDHDAVLLQLGNEAFYSQILRIKVGSKTEQVVVKDILRHSNKPKVLHVDFQRISKTVKIRMQVPLHFINEEESPAVKESKAIVTHLMNNAEVSCLAKDLPEYIDVDLSNLAEGDTVHLSDIKLPDGVEFTTLAADQDQAIASVHMPRGAMEGAAGGGEAAAEGEASAGAEEAAGEEGEQPASED